MLPFLTVASQSSSGGMSTGDGYVVVPLTIFLLTTTGAGITASATPLGCRKRFR